MNDNKLQKRASTALKEKGQYAIAIVVIAAMFVVTGIPMFVVAFFGIFAFFVVKMLAAGSGNETREIFEFYLSANEMLRDDDRRWYGFEIQEVIDRGEKIIQRMSAPPPLVKFALGALYHKSGEHKAAVSKLSQVIEDSASDESSYVYPTTELRNYVKVLRKIEREPADAPLTSAAVRSLERARRVRGKLLLEESRTAFSTGEPKRLNDELRDFRTIAEIDISNEDDQSKNLNPIPATISDAFAINSSAKSRTRRKGGEMSKEEEYADRKPITELLHDIYDRNVS